MSYVSYYSIHFKMYAIQFQPPGHQYLNQGMNTQAGCGKSGFKVANFVGYTTQQLSTW